MSDLSGAAPAALVLKVGTSRSQFFSGLFLIAGINSFAALAVRSITEQGWAGSLANLLGVSAVIWAAFFAGLKILRDSRPGEPLRRADLWVGAMAGAAALIPSASASMVALTLASVWVLATSVNGSSLRRAGLVFLAMSGALVWGRVVLAVFSRPLLDLDAMFVSGLIGAEQQGNLLWYEGGSTRLVVAPGCSSLQGLSLALLFWVIVNQLYEVRFDRRALMSCLAALAATILVNVLRIGSMLLFPEHRDAIHVGWGFQLSMWVTLVAVASICLYGARREVFGRA